MMEENELQQKLAALYARLRQLKAGGVKMKDIAAETGWQPSALSSLYATVLPNLSRYERQGMSFADALTRALGHVNNLSRKKLQADIDLLYRRVMDYAARRRTGRGEPSVSEPAQGGGRRLVSSRESSGGHVHVIQLLLVDESA